MRSCSKKAFDGHKVLGGIPEYKYFKPPYAFDDYNDVALRSTNELTNYCGIDFSGGYVINATDSHSGFLGDGTTYVEIAYYDEAVAENIAQNGRWKPLPVSDDIYKVIYTDHFEAIRNYGIPKIKNGYYFFYDRSDEATDPYDETKFYDRYSYNFTVALYDNDTNRLYYIEADT